MHTQFNQDNFQISNGWVHYVENGERKFVIRTEKTIFKAKAVVKQLCAAHTQEEYFSMLDAGIPPIKILGNKDRGWLLRQMKSAKRNMI